VGELEKMRNVVRTSVVVSLLVGILPLWAIPCPAADVPRLMATARRAGFRVLEGVHLALATDRPPRAGDGVDELPLAFDQAFATWCRHYRLDPAAHAGWKAFGCLIVDRERFRAAGLLPDDVPDFANGFAAGDRFWMADQSNPAYRRHLLLHEGVHCFTLTVRESTAPIWYHEGIAEYLATHRLDAAGGDVRFVPTPIPAQPTDVEQLGRIEQLREMRRAGRCPSVDDVLAAPIAQRNDIGAYATKWALVAMLAGHPHYATAFGDVERGPLAADFNARLARMPGWDAARVSRDFDALTDEIDYGYDFGRSVIDWSPGEERPLPARITVNSARGWQNAGWSLQKGKQYSFTAAGRVKVGEASAGRLDSEAIGISLRWYRGRPVGKLLIAQWIEPDAGTRGSFRVLAEGAAGTLTAATDGPLYLKLNESPGELADNEGALTVTIE
jgi:hypothetical protein